MTKKQRVFIEEYLRCWNATEAALRAGYSERTAYSIGHENLKKPEIANEISKRIKEKAMSADEVLIRLGEQARAEYSEFMTNQGQLDLAKLVKAGKAHLIKKIKKTQMGIEVEFYDAQTALVHLGKHHKLFTEKHEVSGRVDSEVVVNLSWDDDDADD